MAYDGLLVIDKPAGPTSHDVVQRVRKVLGMRRVGHGGTLDPGRDGRPPRRRRPGDAVLPLPFQGEQGLRGPHPAGLRDGHL